MCLGTYGIKVSRHFPLQRGSPKKIFLLHLPLLLPDFHHHAHSALPSFFETQLHVFKLLTPLVISHLHHRYRNRALHLMEHFIMYVILSLSDPL
jgi:hypothetical protein